MPKLIEADLKECIQLLEEQLELKDKQIELQKKRNSITQKEIPRGFCKYFNE